MLENGFLDRAGIIDADVPCIVCKVQLFWKMVRKHFVKCEEVKKIILFASLRLLIDQLQNNNTEFVGGLAQYVVSTKSC